MKRKTKNGFTLVELLAVIVILAIILVIAVPKVMSVIEDSKKATLESTAKMIASAAEKQKVQNTVLGKGDAITCDSVAKINNLDYASCSIEFENNTAKVTIEGKGKFKGLNVCEGTKTSASATNESCELVCEYGIKKTVNVVKPYEVKDYDSCVNYLTSELPNYGASQDIIDEQLPTLCRGESVFEASFSENIEEFIGMGFTEQELIENNVIKVTIEEECLELTPEECFTFDSETGTISGYDETCGTDVVIPKYIGREKVLKIDYPNMEGSIGNNLTSLVLPEGLEEIGDFSFYNNKIERIEIPASVKRIGMGAFYGNPLEYVNLLNTNITIGCGAFGNDDTIEHNLPDTYISYCYPS